jgi:hypothetical protein
MAKVSKRTALTGAGALAAMAMFARPAGAATPGFGQINKLTAKPGQKAALAEILKHDMDQGRWRILGHRILGQRGGAQQRHDSPWPEGRRGRLQAVGQQVRERRGPAADAGEFREGRVADGAASRLLAIDRAQASRVVERFKAMGNMLMISATWTDKTVFKAPTATP